MTIQLPPSARRAILFVLLLINGACARALGVGDITLSSRLGEPLRAQVTLTGAGDLTSDQVIVRIAPQSVYDQLGVERDSDVLSLKFHVGEDHKVSITTAHPIKEPYLNFVMEVVWPQGQVFREYKLLIDPS